MTDGTRKCRSDFEVSSRCELPIICGKGYFGIQTRAKNHFKPSKPLPYPSTLPKEQQKLQFDVNVTKWLRWFQSNDPIFKQLLSRKTDKKPRYQFIWPNNGNLICLSQSNRWFSRICNRRGAEGFVRFPPDSLLRSWTTTTKKRMTPTLAGQQPTADDPLLATVRISGICCY